MKIFKSFFLIALMALSFSLHANDETPASKFNLGSKIVNDNTISYQLTNLQEMVATVKITSINGKTTFYHNTVRNHNGFSENINIENLRDGRYVFVVKQGTISKKQVIRMRGGKVTASSITG